MEVLSESSSIKSESENSQIKMKLKTNTGLWHHSYFQKASDTYSTWWEDGGHHDSREELNEMIPVISFYRN